MFSYLSSKCPTFIMAANTETLLVMKVVMAKGPPSQLSALPPSFYKCL